MTTVWFIYVYNLEAVKVRCWYAAGLKGGFGAEWGQERLPDMEISVAQLP
jgi:hypothetical protein